MNIIQETNDYFSTTEGSNYTTKNGVVKGINTDRYIMVMDFSEKNSNSFSALVEIRDGCYVSEYCNANSALKDKLKTTPDRGIKKISKVFRVDWGKVFKIK
jgi:hypothetical protein